MEVDKIVGNKGSRLRRQGLHEREEETEGPRLGLFSSCRDHRESHPEPHPARAVMDVWHAELNKSEIVETVKDIETHSDFIALCRCQVIPESPGLSQPMLLKALYFDAGLGGEPPARGP
jgi:hypothetical protein